MQVILKPVGQPELGEIIIKDELFAIGRHEPPFSDYDAKIVGKLSRRHARIFEQDGVVYIADLGSLNGTTVNGASVDSLPVRLQRGDEICFTGYLCYQIEILGAAVKRPSEEPAAPPVQLVLVPERQQDILEPIVVTQFPFLVNKASDVFARYKDSLPKEVTYISRRHAHIFLKGNNLYIEDLGSTNGTFVSGVRLEEHARQLQQDDVVAFGGDNFVYRVELMHAIAEEDEEGRENSELLTGTAHAMDDVTRTTFVTSANSFLDIFCVEDANADARRQEGKSTHAGLAEPSGNDIGPEGGRGGLFARPRSIIREMRGSRTGERKRGSVKIWFAAIALTCLIGTWIYLEGAPKREIRDLLEQDNYTQALASANRYLQANPDDREVSDLATEAVLKAVVPPWMGLVTAGDFPGAEEQVEQGKRLSRPGTESQNLLDTLLWITQLEQFTMERGGSGSPIVMFQHEDRINKLIKWWDADPKAHHRILGTISQHVPEFAEVRARVFSHVRALHSQRSLSVAAIERMLAEVKEALQENDTGSLQTILADFQETYPRITGVDKLRSDLDVFTELDADMRAENWIRAQRLADETEFKTVVFRDRVRFILDNELPSPDIVDRYREASTDWKNGNTEEAMRALEKLKTERWGVVAERRLQRNRQIISEYAQLKVTRGQPRYDKTLLAFYRMLDPERDAYFVNSVEEEFQLHRSKALSEAERSFSEARTAWNAYREKGGIRGLHRLEAGVSSTYRRLATLLSDAYQHMTQGMEIYKLLKAGYADEWNQLYARISNEVRLQRQSLLELAMVLEPSLKQAKLELLPVLLSGESGEVTGARLK